jgi:hypothetical protein
MDKDNFIIKDINKYTKEKANELRQQSKNLLYELHGIDPSKYKSELINNFVDCIMSATILEVGLIISESIKTGEIK